MKTTSDLIYFGSSLLLHLTVMLFVLFRIFIFPSERPELIKAIRVDLVALPDKNPQEGPVGTPPPDEPLAEKEKPPKDVAKEAVSETKKPEFVEKKTEKKEEKLNDRP